MEIKKQRKGHSLILPENDRGRKMEYAGMFPADDRVWFRKRTKGRTTIRSFKEKYEMEDRCWYQTFVSVLTWHQNSIVLVK